MHLMRRLADQGRTIVMVTHATKNVMLADKVVFWRAEATSPGLAHREALEYFNQYRSEREQRAQEMEFDQIYAILDDPAKEKPRIGLSGTCNTRPIKNTSSSHCSRRDIDHERSKRKTSRESRQGKEQIRVSGFRQFMILSARNIKILSRDRTSLILMLLVPVLVASLDFFLASAMENNYMITR